ncbi:hypothetical protein FA15DRAFT_754756 [Coprinopsis marcescibilis]|uniref:F-box domain-containing protein n=1 Tax=Coprinopsis marcescibilis TaxID=230819 RepID=A0A5C3L201_COPMA|nr:hypothetical protein FA15DRAFT_754756 [Coprinopsis marcescibilis]
MDIDPDPSAASGRQLRQRKKQKYDLDDSDDDENSLQTKKVSRRTPRSPSTRRIRKAGKLASFVNLPLDILHEIFGHLHPYDLLKLARTTKDFRRILMQRSSISTWRASFSELDSLPECPPGMSEPSWANLVFSPHCHICLTAGVRNVEWRFRIRMCSKCAPQELIETYHSQSVEDLYRPLTGGFGFDASLLPDLVYLLPNREGKRFRRVFMREDLINFRDSYGALETPEERLAFIDERRKAIEALNMHSTNCGAWSHNQADDRSGELQKLRQERKQAIMKTLEQLGYKKDLDDLRNSDSLDRQPFVNKPQRLTDRIWNNIRPAALKFMNDVREKRLERELKPVVIQRKAHAGRFLRDVKNRMLPCTDLLPEAPNFCGLRPVQEILTQPVDSTVDVSTFEHALPNVNDIFRSWREQVIRRLHFLILSEEISMCLLEQRMYPRGSRQMLEQLSGPGTEFRATDLILAMGIARESPHPVSTLREINTRMRLATTVYSCRACVDLLVVHNDREGDYRKEPLHLRTKPLFYPQVLGHRCLTRASSSWAPSDDASLSLEKLAVRRTELDMGKIQLETRHCQVAASVVKAAGMDPATTTAEDMDRLDIRFRCKDCGPWFRQSRELDGEHGPDQHDTPSQGCYVQDHYSWRAAVRHQINVHQPPANGQKHPAGLVVRDSGENLAIVTSADPVMAKIRKVEQGVERQAPIWCCAHCRDTPQELPPQGLAKVLKHVKLGHEKLEPVLNEDYFRHYCAVEIMSSDPEYDVVVDV